MDGCRTFRNEETTFLSFFFSCSKLDILFLQIWSSSNTRGAVGISDLIEGSHIHTLDLQKRKILLNA